MSRASILVPSAEQNALLEQLVLSRYAVLAAVQKGVLTAADVQHLADERTDLTIRLHLMPLAPAAHLRAAHALSRRHLERLPLHDPARVVVADETHSYTPRKILRRVLDHALDHLNQIEQWRRWQENGSAPEPTDGWATSAETFAEDVQPLAPEELAAWLWRIDLTLELVARHADHLSTAQLDWAPPDGGWTLRQMLHHLARAEVYYVVWLDQPLPEEPVARYIAASERFQEQLHAVFTAARSVSAEGEPLVLFADAGSGITTGEEVARSVLAVERSLVARQ